METRTLEAIIPVELAGRRTDQALAELFPDYSRSRLGQWVREGRVRIEGRIPRSKDKVAGGERVVLEPLVEPDERWEPESIPLDIVFEDAAIIVINKPAGLVVHPAAGNRSGTLVNALLHHDPGLAAVPRAGVVHRLDKDTTGLLVVARHLKAQASLVEQLQARRFEREYDALVNGVLTGGGTVDAPIGRHPVDRKRMAVVERGKPAVTHYRVEERFAAHTRLKVRLETGRTHQIRVHMAFVRHPLIGDPVYGSRLRVPAGADEHLRQTLRSFGRQALHAARLGLAHPDSGLWMAWEAPLPADFDALLGVLRRHAEGESS